MQFTLFAATAIALVAAGPLSSRYYNETTVAHTSAGPSIAAPITWSSSLESSAAISTAVLPSASSSNAVFSPIPASSSVKSSNSTTASAPTTAPYAMINGINGTAPTAIVKPEHPVTTVYQPEIVVVVINQITVVVTVYNAPVTTALGDVITTIFPQPKVTSTQTKGTETIVVIQPVTQAPIPTITSTIKLGDVISTVLVVPSAGPASTLGGPAPTQAAAPTYTYTALNNVCVCPLPSTVTQYVTVQTSPAASTPAAATTTTPASAPANCAAPATAAYPTLFPGFIIPVKASSPAQSFGTQYSASISADQEVVFQFNIAKTGKCSLNLALPPKNQLTTSSWAVTGDGIFSFAKLPTSVVESVSYAQLPGGLSFSDFTAVQGGTAVLGGTFDCVAGTTATFVLKSKNGATAQFFEDFNCPYVGLSVVQA
ncbi:Putative uncharacterized protein [Taphrina deformans PYCC 5710]|uniref:Ubiquitin 3 binding protein But2 C-terminal domain-containing protein n=1 Tax=Taphrina deformans (strain PYCC 5710 / ATCC 11124 / CBS 356.35 / IMI 108563 / JCM 9778 / NBRC 8474) TaxID=1097556 RepID=R4XDQ8_TAPDE|nr:Putative uncharacterized protein [Taphrina deformans PYCC 5710]|eukprot:CCG81474.1 Putative uncharacterized protein [Taphrina deformans PYCC 5710]